jgi:hypothetical protein
MARLDVVESTEREDRLRYAARLKGLALIRMAEGYALAAYEFTGASLDEVEQYLGTDGSKEAAQRRAEEMAFANVRAMIEAAHEMAAEAQPKTEQQRESLREGLDSLAPGGPPNKFLV